MGKKRKTKEEPRTKRLRDVKTKEYHLEVYRCVCGICIGMDVRYVKKMKLGITYCPKCGKRIESIPNQE